MMSKNYIRKLVPFIIWSLLVILSFWSCDEFQSDDYVISDLDNIACQLLQDSSSINLLLMDITKINPAWVDSVLLDSVPTIMDSLGSKKKNKVIKIITLSDTIPDTCYSISTPATLDTNYALLSTDVGGIVCYIDTNKVDMTIFNKEGQIVAPASKAIALETIRQCENIQVRYEYNLADDRNLIRFIELEKMPFRLVVLVK